MLFGKEVTMPDEQLFPVASHVPAEQVELTAATPLHAALGGFREYLDRRDLTENTIKSFLYDLNILGQFIGQSRHVGDVSTKDLKDYIEWLQHGRGVPCNQKSLARRITSLKVFFAWLFETGVLPSDPAAPLVHKPVSTPLPDILFDSQVEQLVATTNLFRHGDPQGAGERKPDARPHLLVTLLLSTGIKKSECMALVLNHLDFSDPAMPAVWIRYGDARHRHKERKLKLPTDWPRVLEEYKAQYTISDKVFPCTARNLEYVLRDVSALAGLKPVSFEMLRWTCAVRDYQAGMSPEQLRHKLGLSRITWEETGGKIARLAAPAV
jgi:integrase/recombinase XerD